MIDMQAGGHGVARCRFGVIPNIVAISQPSHPGRDMASEM
jgi:hypothetical protein